MREIKFRAKRINSDTMETMSEWVYGFYVETKDGSPYIRSNTDFLTYMIDPTTLGQCTNLKDAKGKIIYEGDVLAMKNKDFPFGIVMWHNDGYFCVEEHLKRDEPTEHISLGELLRVEVRGIVCNFVVMGNRVDNPELFKQNESQD